MSDNCNNHLTKLQRKISEVRKERHHAENDANLIGNRLNLLKEEENKVCSSSNKQTWNNLEKSRQKETVKVANLQKMEEEKRQIQELQEKKQKEIDERKEENLRRKEETKNNFLLKKDYKLKQLKQETLLLNEQRKVFLLNHSKMKS